MRIEELDSNIPKKSGVYFFRNKEDEILYIGKATELRSRVRSYFKDDLHKQRGQLIVDMVAKAHVVTWEETSSALEALLLESHLIKKEQPYYNTREKDDRSYYYVVITKEDWPRIFLERGRKLTFKDSLKYPVRSVFGPFPSGKQIRIALKIIRKIFPYRGKKVSVSTERFYAQLGLAPDQSTSDSKVMNEILERYLLNIKAIERLFKGKKKGLVSELEKQMKQQAKVEQFERAARTRDKLWSLGHINDIALIQDGFYNDALLGEIPFERIEAYDIAHLDSSAMVGVMAVLVHDQPDKSQYRLFNIRSTKTQNDIKSLYEIVFRRCSPKNISIWGTPDLLVIDGPEAQRVGAQRAVDERGINVPVISVVKDEKHNPKEILGAVSILEKIDPKVVLLANNEAHRFALKMHTKKRDREFLNK